MSDTTISTSADVMTMTDVFKAHEGQQQRLVDVLVEATESTIAAMPGFVSATIHRGEDGTSVVNHVQRAAAIAAFDPIVCVPVEVVHVPQGGGRA